MMKLLQSSSGVFSWVKRLWLTFLGLSLCVLLKAQSFNVEGTVLDDTGFSVPEVNVLTIVSMEQATSMAKCGYYRSSGYLYKEIF